MSEAVDIDALRQLMAKATAGPFDHMEGMGIVRALRGDLAIPLFETRTPWGDRIMGETILHHPSALASKPGGEGDDGE